MTPIPQPDPPNDGKRKSRKGGAGKSSSKKVSPPKSKVTNLSANAQADEATSLKPPIPQQAEVPNLAPAKEAEVPNLLANLLANPPQVPHLSPEEKAKLDKAYKGLYSNKGPKETLPPKVMGQGHDAIGPHPSLVKAMPPIPRLPVVEEDDSEVAATDGETVSNADQEMAEVPVERIRHLATGLIRSGATSDLVWPEDNDDLLGKKDQEAWWSGLFEYWQPEHPGEILTLLKTPSFIQRRLVEVSENNTNFRKDALLREVRYLRDLRLYITARRCTKQGGWTAVKSLPSKLINKADREYFTQHALERDLDVGDDIGTAMREALEEWQQDDDPGDTFSSYWTKAKKRLPRHQEPDLGVVQPPADLSHIAAEVVIETKSEDAEEEHILDLPGTNQPVPMEQAAEAAAPVALVSGQPRLTAVQMRKLEFVANYEGEDPKPRPGGPTSSAQLMQHPLLNCCPNCGQEGSGTHSCQANTGTSFQPPTNPFADLFPVAEGSMAQTQLAPTPAKCNYTYCSTLDYHVVQACPSLHERCGTCRVRGHNDQPHPAHDNRVLCPVVREPTGKTEGPTYTDLQRAFEAVADLGFLTRWRTHGFASCGFYPARSMRCIKFVVTMGYHALLRTNTEVAIGICNNFFQATRVVGLGPQFDELQDYEIREISNLRDQAAAPPPTKKARRSSSATADQTPPPQAQQPVRRPPTKAARKGNLGPTNPFSRTGQVPAPAPVAGTGTRNTATQGSGYYRKPSQARSGSSSSAASSYRGHGPRGRSPAPRGGYGQRGGGQPSRGSYGRRGRQPPPSSSHIGQSPQSNATQQVVTKQQLDAAFSVIGNLGDKQSRGDRWEATTKALFQQMGFKD